MNNPTGEIDMTPWDALLSEVRRSSYRAAYIDHRVADEDQRERQLKDEHDSEAARFDHAAEVRRWLDQSRKERTHLLRVSKAAIDAGLSEKYVHSIQIEAQLIVKVVERALDVVDLTYDEKEAVALEMRDALRDVSTELFNRHGLVPVTQGKVEDT